ASAPITQASGSASQSSRASPKHTTEPSPSRRGPMAGSALRWNYRPRRAPTPIASPFRWLADVAMTKEKRDGMTVQRMDNVGIVVDDLPATVAFFRELGLELEGQAGLEGEWAGRVTGPGRQGGADGLMRTPGGLRR